MSKIIQLGNLRKDSKNFTNPQTGRVYSEDGLAPKTRVKIRMMKMISIIDDTYGFEKGCRYYKKFCPTLRNGRNGLKVMENIIRIKQATKKGFIECKIGGVADLSYPNSKTRRGRVQECGTVSPTVTTTTNICKIEDKSNKIIDTKPDNNIHTIGNYMPSNHDASRIVDKENIAPTVKENYGTVTGVEQNLAIRKLTPKECWRLMGFSDEDFEKAKNAGVSNTQLYKQAGNSIVTDVLYYIFKELYTVMPYLFEDLKVSSYFSGIGAFEIALDRLFNDINSENFQVSQMICPTSAK